MLLRKDDPWNRELDYPDIRDWRVVDSNDNAIGFVQSVVVNRQDKKVVALLTGANDRFSINDVQLEERLIRLKTSPEIRGEQHAAQESESKSYEDAFRGHYRDAYSDSDVTYDSVEDAYQFGRRMALDADYSGRSYDRSREALRAHWFTQKSGLSFERAEDAIRFAFELVQGIGRYRMTGIEREGAQILGRSGRKDDESERAGATMTTGRPRSSNGDGLRPRSPS